MVLLGKHTAKSEVKNCNKRVEATMKLYTLALVVKTGIKAYALKPYTIQEKTLQELLSQLRAGGWRRRGSGYFPQAKEGDGE
jgi:hypothetical protein